MKIFIIESIVTINLMFIKSKNFLISFKFVNMELMIKKKLHILSLDFIQ